MDDTLKQIYQSLTDLDNYDPDLRFMALNDIYKVLYEDQSARQLASQRVLQRVTTGILKSLEDKNTEIQNQAVKALGALVIIQEAEVDEILRTVLAGSTASKDLALRAVITSAPKTVDTSNAIIHQVLPQMCLDDGTPSIEVMDVFLELVHHYSRSFKQADIDAALHRTRHLIRSEPGLIAKRAYEIELELVPLLSDSQLATIIQDVVDAPSVGGLNLLAGIVELVGAAKLPSGIVEFTLELVEIDEDKVSITEGALLLLRGLVAARSTLNAQIAPKLEECISYDPNRGDADADDMVEDDEFMDSDVDEDAFDDDEESWKIRRAAVKVVQAGNAELAAEFTPLLMSTLAYELNEPVKRELLTCLGAVAEPDNNQPAERRRRNSDASMQTNAGVLTPFVDQLLKLAGTDDATVEYLPLLVNLIKYYDVVGPTLVDICLVRFQKHKSAQIFECLRVVLELLRAGYRDGRMVQIIRAGIERQFYQTQVLALQCAVSLGSDEILPDIDNVVATGVSAALRIAAFDAAVKIVAAGYSDRSDQYVQMAVQILKTQREQRVATINSVMLLFRQPQVGAHANTHTEQSLAPLVRQLLDMFTTTSASLTCSCLELLDLVVVPSMASQVAKHVLALPNDAQYIDLKCKVLAYSPQEPGVTEFALEVAQIKDYTSVRVPTRHAVMPIIALFGRIAATTPGLLQQVTKVYKETPMWAEVIAEIMVASEAPTPQPSDPLTNWFMLLALYLTLRGRPVTVDGLDMSGVDADIDGYYMGAAAIASNTTSAVLESAAQGVRTNMSVVLCGLEVILTRADLNDAQVDTVWATVAQLRDEQLDEKNQQILARVVGRLYASTGNSDQFKQWDGTVVGLEAAKVAFPEAESQVLKTSILRKFIAAVKSSNVKVRGIAAKSLAWAAQTEPSIVEPYLDEILENALAATVKIPELVKTVKIGPYTHEIDEGLEYRKASYELIYLCVYNFPQVAVRDTRPLLRGISETEDHDIKILTCLVFEQLALNDVKVLEPIVADILALFKNNDDIKVKETGIKLEHDRKAALTQQIDTTRKMIQAKLDGTR